MKASIKFALQVLYNVGFMTFFFITGPFFLWRLWRRGKLLPQFGQRFGLYSKDVRDRLAPGCDLWIHAVSVGEVKIARVLIRRLREKRPDLRVVVSTTTGTGFTVAKQHLEDAQTSIVYNPIDFLWSVVSAYKLIRPRLLILIESEIWPNYLWCARRRNIPVYLVNTRLSDRSEERYRRLRWLVRPLLQEIDLVFAQDATDVSRLTQAGFAPETIFNLGSLKYDVAALDTSAEKDISAWWNRTGWGDAQSILLGGSTHPGEEEVLVRIYRELRDEWPRLRLVLAPRHAERGAAIRDMCDRMGLRAVTRTQLAASHEPLGNGSSPDVLVVNSTGELSSLYKRATLAFVGKSLRGQGGQNFIEAAPVGTPIVIGPNMQNFKVITREFINQQAIVQVTDEFELANCLHALFASDEIRRELGNRARATFEANLGAAQRTAEVIVRSLSNLRKEPSPVSPPKGPPAPPPLSTAGVGGTSPG
ncbi:MAG: 3-deoxy-D-manno-octulosonic acid transferase [Methylacidiphilales bacterium]|nr:3-deoxy-D-manno-octulosonic acid transferase [Candidatus Methylacidiphilales bacterium]